MEIRIDVPKLSPLAYGIVSNWNVGTVHILLDSVPCAKDVGLIIVSKADVLGHGHIYP